MHSFWHCLRDGSIDSFSCAFCPAFGTAPRLARVADRIPQRVLAPARAAVLLAVIRAAVRGLPAGALGVVFAAALGVAPAGANAMSLGQAELHSGLGQPLAVRINLNATDQDDLGCVTVKARDDLPPPVGLHVQVLGDARGKYLDLSSTQAVNDPAIALIVSAGCAAPLSREYVLLINPGALAPALAPTIPPASTSRIAPSDAATAANAPRELAGESLAAGSPPVAGTSPATAPRARRSAANALGASRRRGATGEVAVATAPQPQARSGEGAKAGAAAPHPAVPQRLGPTRTAQPPAHDSGERPAATASVLQKADPGKGDRLHLSRATDDPDLRIASDLSLSDDAPSPDEAHLAELRLEQARLMAILNGQDPGSVSSPREQELQKQVTEITSSMNVLRQQVREAQQKSEAAGDGAPAGLWPWILGACAVLALTIAGWFGWRYRSAQDVSADNPWWEQSQLASARPNRSEPDEIPFGPSIGEDDEDTVTANTLRGNTNLRTGPSTRPAPRPNITPPRPPTPRIPYAGPVARSAPPATGPSTREGPTIHSPGAPARGIAPTKPPAEAASAPAGSLPAEPPSAAPALTRGSTPSAAPAPAAAQTPGITSSVIPYGAVSTVVGSLDERVDSTELTRSAIDFNLDLPEITSPTEAPAAAPAAAAPTASAPPPGAPAPVVPGRSPRAAEAFNLKPLDFDLPNNPVKADAGLEPDPESMGPDTILRLDEPPADQTAMTRSMYTAEQASIQFTLLQFASVIDQATELHAGGEATKAIALLRQYVLRDESIPTLMWLMLFDLYRQVNKKPVYDALAEHFSRRYKRPMARWEETLEQKAPQLGLTEVPDIDRELQARWGTPQGLQMIMSLLCERDRSDSITFNAVLQRDLLQKAKIYPIADS